MEESYSFLHSTQANGVSFGMWGWCLDDGLTCSPIHRFGYTWPPEIDTPITKSFVLYLIAYALTFFTLIAAFLALCARKGRNFDQIFNILAWSSFFTSATATIFSIAIYSTAKSAFEEHGFGATYGLLAWISPITTTLLSLVALRAYYHVLLSKKARKQCSTATSGDVES
ncbi:hypothetical protein BDN70DRAFT_885412 [Pholiota conissans]|uniref:Uncharacterized protein n=1 Tax=Pholiota conissans TaxID=109636 RepID=A0A9P5YQB0_9AGAR|nr:hypothetical protein BDN70DRAFT_885412 [Pholiota conissans]